MGKLCEYCEEEMDVSEYHNNICFGCIALELENLEEVSPTEYSEGCFSFVHIFS